MSNLSFGFSVASYLNDEPNRINKLYCLVYSFLSQSYENWKLNIVHDGKITDEKIRKKYYELELLSEKIKCFESNERLNHWGHEYRREYALKTDCDILGFTNEDNYYNPKILNLLNNVFLTKECNVVISECIHRIKNDPYLYKILKSTKPIPKNGTIDLCCYFLKRELVNNTEWKSFGYGADFSYITKIIKENKTNIHFINFPLMFHN